MLAGSSTPTPASAPMPNAAAIIQPKPQPRSTNIRPFTRKLRRMQAAPVAFTEPSKPSTLPPMPLVTFCMIFEIRKQIARERASGAGLAGPNALGHAWGMRLRFFGRTGASTSPAAGAAPSPAGEAVANGAAQAAAGAPLNGAGPPAARPSDPGDQAYEEKNRPSPAGAAPPAAGADGAARTGAPPDSPAAAARPADEVGPSSRIASSSRAGFCPPPGPANTPAAHTLVDIKSSIQIT